MAKTPNEIAGEVVAARAAWLEDVLAGLLANGVRKDEIEIQERAGNHTVVCVRGEAKYEWRWAVSASDLT